MTVATFKKSGGALKPADPTAEAVLDKIKLGQLVAVDVRRPRNLAHHRKYWALLQVVVDNLDQPLTVDALHDLVKLRTGHVTPVRTKRGIVEIPGSISFAAMDQTAFENFYDRAVAFLAAEVIPGVGKETLAAEVNAILDGYK